MSQPAPTPYYNKLYDPLVLYASCVVSPQSGGAPNVVALMNPHGMSMELMEVRWRIYPNNTDINQFLSLTGMGIATKMDMGDIPIVDAEVPLTSFGTSRDIADRPLSDQVSPNPEIAPTVVANAFTYKWRLKHPLLVPPGCVVTPTYQHLGQNQFPVTVQTLYICRTLPQNYVVPQSLYAPWVGSYNSVSFDNLTSQPAGRDFSSELDIVNPFMQPLALSRIAASCSGVFTANGLGYNVEVSDYFRYQLGKLRIRSRSGDEVARTKTPFNGLFPMGWRAWDVPPGMQLRSGEFWKLNLTVDETSATAPLDTSTGSIQFSVAGTGYRQLPTDVFVAAAKGAA